ncbi:MAG TPA: hypothetical protein VJU13_08700, partial [Candidatus Nitrosocosmicus sp.]|nr:hypothetical protein [Candidatus Nitrosocosmicus sp.]
FFNGLASDVDEESVFSVSTASSDCGGLVLTFFNALASDVDVGSEPALLSSLQHRIFDGVIMWSLSVAPKETELYEPANKRVGIIRKKII